MKTTEDIQKEIDLLPIMKDLKEILTSINKKQGKILEALALVSHDVKDISGDINNLIEAIKNGDIKS